MGSGHGLNQNRSVLCAHCLSFNGPAVKPVSEFLIRHGQIDERFLRLVVHCLLVGVPLLRLVQADQLFFLQVIDQLLSSLIAPIASERCVVAVGIHEDGYRLVLVLFQDYVY